MSSPENLPVAGTAVLLRDASAGIEVLMMRRPDRGSFAGAWVFPGGKVEPDDRQEGSAEVDDARRAAVRETAEEVGLAIADLVPLSQWHPPIQAPTRIRTWFFVGAAPEHADPVAAPAEVAAVAWTTPAAALARHATGEWTLFPPTWVTLHRLTGFADMRSVLAAATSPALFETRVVDTESGRDFAWAQGRLETSALPWRFLDAAQA